MAISLGKELAKAGVGAATAGIGSFTGALTITTATNLKALGVAGISAGVTALTFFASSMKAWLDQTTPPQGG